MLLSDNDNWRRWRLADIDFQAVDPALVHDDELLFYMIASASFVEILSGLYSRNLIEHFQDNADIVQWLEHRWQHEEVQHGRALKAYVQTVWPEFDWEGTYQTFLAEYSVLCTAPQLEASPALEMVARCVVETGTATMYRALHDYVREPVLRQLFAHIKADEANHYRYFRDFFDACNLHERRGAWSVLGAVRRRIAEVRAEDSYIAFKHVFGGRHPGRTCQHSDWQRYMAMVKQHARHYYPYPMAIRMLSKPVPLAAPLKRLLESPLVALARLLSRA